jgi:hypothetical protein
VSEHEALTRFHYIGVPHGTPKLRHAGFGAAVV